MGSLVVNKAKVTPETAEALVKVCPFGAISYEGGNIDISHILLARTLADAGCFAVAEMELQTRALFGLTD